MTSKYNLTGRLTQGDSLKLLPTLSAESVDLILTDPPYAINYRSNRRTSRPKFPYINGDQPGDWIESFAAEAYRLLRQNRHLYCFCRYDTYPRFYQAFENAGFKMKRTLIWVKNNHGSGDLKGDYAPKDEWIIYAHKGRRALKGDRVTNILEYDKIHSAKLLHPTQKPVDLLERLIVKSSKPGELVFDPFAGVSSTGIAAMNRNRTFHMIENYHEYVESGEARIREHKHADNYSLTFHR